MIFLKIKDNKINKFITITLSLSFIIMIAISILDLIPLPFLNILQNGNIITATIITTIYFVTGYLIVKTLSKLISNNTENLFKLGILNMLVLICHNYPEGIITFFSSYTDITIGIKLSIGIIFHNIAEGMCIAVPIYHATKSKSKALLYSLLAGLAEPIGALSTYLFFKNYITLDILDRIMIITGGMMITLSINEIFPRIYKDRKNLVKGIIFGIIWVIISQLIF